MSPKPVKQPSVLIIDDEVATRALIEHILLPEGYQIFQADSAQAGITQFEQHLPEVVLTDLSMPGVSGLEMLGQLGAAVIDRHAFIVLTSHSEDEAIEQCYALGVKSFLQKPVGTAALRGLVRRSIELLQANNQLRKLNLRFSTLLNNLPELVWECDDQYHFTFTGAKWEAALQFSIEELSYRSLVDLVHPDDRHALWVKTTSGDGPPPAGQAVHFKSNFHAVELRFIAKDGTEVPMQLSAERVQSRGGELFLTGVARDISAYPTSASNIVSANMNMEIWINGDLALFDCAPDLHQFLPQCQDAENPTDHPKIKDILADPTLEPMFRFAIDQKEDLPFPVELTLTAANNKPSPFKAEFCYDPEKGCIKGKLSPADLSGQIAALTDLAQEQSKSLEQAVIVDDQTRVSILKDCGNLLVELLDLSRELARFAYNDESDFTISQYQDFMHTRSWGEAAEHLRFLANKVHSLKGTLGFLIPAGKTLCHQFEEIIKPLAAMRLVLTVNIQTFMKLFFFGIEELIEKYEAAPDQAYGTGDWISKINDVKERAQLFIDGYEDDLEHYLQSRTQDTGEVRKRKKEEYLSVEKHGYHKLIEQMQQLYYSVVGTLPEQQMLGAAKKFNEIVEKHQQIQRVPFNISRYERLIPSIAKEYGKQAVLEFEGDCVRATAEFWNSIHEILNHLIKNAVIHGLESPEERLESGKDPAGKIQVILIEEELMIEVSVLDDGRGVDTEKVKAKVIETGKATAEELELMTQSEVLDLLFLQGVSTANTVDQNAGRGVGLNAVQEAMNGFGGKCTITSKTGQGTQWAFAFPKSNVSLNFVILRIGSFHMAVPSNQIDSFVPLTHDEKFGIGKEGSGILYKGNVIQVLEPRQILGDQIQVEADHTQQYMVFKSKHKTQSALKVNDILFQATLPLFPAPQEYIASNAVLGMTLYQERPVLVLDPEVGVKEAIY